VWSIVLILLAVIVVSANPKKSQITSAPDQTTANVEITADATTDPPATIAVTTAAPATTAPPVTTVPPAASTAPTPKPAAKPTPPTTPKPAPPTTSKPAPPTTSAPPTSPALPRATVSQANAAKAAQGYLKFSAFSCQGLIDQLIYEKYSSADAQYGANATGVCTDPAVSQANAAKAAQQYLKSSAFSCQELIDQLIYEQYSAADALYGATSTGLC
jgi:outer membrane biosynthesis protein TonB